MNRKMFTGSNFKEIRTFVGETGQLTGYCSKKGEVYVRTLKGIETLHVGQISLENKGRVIVCLEQL